MGRVILAASWVAPVDGPPLRDGHVAVEGGRVTWVGRAGDPASPEAPVRDMGPGVLLPGLVNAHCHLELSHLAGQVPLGDGFVAWVEGLVEARTRRGEDAARDRAAGAIRLIEERGTVAVGDVSNSLLHLGLLATAHLRTVLFLELLAWDPARAEASVTWAEEQLAAVRARAPGVEVRLAAHAPHSVSPELFRRLVERGGVGAIHLAESSEESRFLATGDGPWTEFLARRGFADVSFDPSGTSPVAYAETLGLLHSSLVAAHCVQVDGDDRARLAERGVSVALCPRSNRNLGVGTADVPALLEAGVRLCLGSDSLASVETIDVFDDAVLLAKQFPDLDPAAIVRMATAGGAEALGLDDLGTLAPGKRAAMAFAPADFTPADPCAYLLSGRTRLQRVLVA